MEGNGIFTLDEHVIGKCCRHTLNIRLGRLQKAVDNGMKRKFPQTSIWE
jgi:hypothetical protein